ncbi:hypothetical protein CRUP_007745 [Coryphaenoides rupestris]|nr:hypothetical protein CRUP_007745 [Coryphaenoides rupestris]
MRTSRLQPATSRCHFLSCDLSEARMVLRVKMYRNLLFLKSYQGDVEELGLNFTIVNNDLGEAQVVELKPGGKDVPVTTANRIAYIHLVLISGAHVPICLDDLKKFTNYSGGYTATHPVIQSFWEVVEGFIPNPAPPPPGANQTHLHFHPDLTQLHLHPDLTQLHLHPDLTQLHIHLELTRPTSTFTQS